MSGELWYLWESFEDEGPPPRLLENGRWAEMGSYAFWHYALLGDGDNAVAGHRLRLSTDSGLILFEGWRDLPGVTKAAAWVASDLGLLRWVTELHAKLLDARPGERVIADVFAQLDACESAAAFCAWVDAAPSSEIDPPEPVLPPSSSYGSLEFALRLTQGLASDPELFDWLRPFVDRVPGHARLVTREHRLSGMPAPGSVWWRTGDAGLDWVIATPREAYERELSTGRASTTYMRDRIDAAGKSFSRSQTHAGVARPDFQSAPTGVPIGLMAGYNSRPALRAGELWLGAPQR